ncbi:hypothetical protein [Brevibacillus sp. HB2.2]|uniref:hypothetical protein n=1 Tax=Brevibacillus sp. HB2.2 TaxID=2738846 RepID=UPI00156B3D94|nr:hypothetical protein [Brevibacillus sp. HB2.2]NRS52070.1 hypothetical protein [Brevibacillus sp. HB2.2]
MYGYQGYYPYQVNFGYGYQIPNEQFQLIQRQQPLDLSTEGATNSQNLGNGFHRYAWEERTIPGSTYLGVRIFAGSKKVITAGYGVAKYAPIYAMESFPRTANQWYMTIYNPTDADRQLGIYLIAKD